MTQSELKTLQPAESITLSTGETLSLKPLPFGKTFEALGLLTNIMGNGSIGYEALTKDPSIAGAVIGQVLIQGGEDVFKFLSLCTGKEREWFNDISMPDGIKLTTMVLELNSDFFVQQALPVLKGSLGKIQAMKGMLAL